MELIDISSDEFMEFTEFIDADIIKEWIITTPALKQQFIESYGDQDERYWCEDCEEFSPLELKRLQEETLVDPSCDGTFTTCCGMEL